MRVAEVHAGAGRRRDLLVHRELLALIPGQRAPQRLRQASQHARDRAADAVGRRDAVGEREQDQEPRRALHERSDRRPVPGAHDQIALPVTGLQTIRNLSGALIDHPHRGQPSAPLQATQPPAPAPATHRSGDLDCRIVDRLIDRFLAEPPRRLPDEHLPELVRDLLRAPPLTQQLPDRFGQHRVEGDPPRPRSARPEPGGALGLVRAIPAVGFAVSADLAADRRRCAAELQRDPADRHPGGTQVGDPDPLLL